MTDERANHGLDPSGPALFARYAYPPNALGYCGPNEPGALLEAGSQEAGGTSERARQALLGQLARRFEGAWPYLELIAGANHLTDPLDRRVVEAYWVGNELLEGVGASAIAASLDERFARRAGARFDFMREAAWRGGLVQHGFHVFAVYPWIGMLRAGHEDPALTVLDRCRVRWGRVIAVTGDVVTVAARPLVYKDNRLQLGDEVVEEARRALEGVGFVGDLRVGEIVSLHWDWVCDRLSSRSLSWLYRTTEVNLRVVNDLSRPGPATALEGGPARFASRHPRPTLDS